MSITNLQLLRNLGQFDNVAPGAQLPFTKLTLFYAENGRGKTTIASLLRSVAVNEPQLVLERQRLGSAHPPHVVIGRPQGAVIF
jgi:wobble nucleotide-excising tRNase